MPGKIIVGVHGIGDQVRYETTQAIAYQFCRHYQLPAAVPLGSFYNTDHDGIVALPHGSGTLYFTEAYWADIARQPETAGYTLEETKSWAKTIVERFRTQVHQRKARSSFIKNKTAPQREPDRELLYLKHPDGEHYQVRLNYPMIRSVLYEAIDTVDVLEKLLFVASKAHLLEFNLKWVLTNFLGDVQIVAEFAKYRGEIIDTFIDTLSRAYAVDPAADIHVICHSEGTVVSFLGLLEAIRRGQQACPWLANVKGFMTLGSPLDKHLTLWPQLWDDYLQLPDMNGLQGQIKWRNYYDRGDPVGYELDTARQWVGAHCRAFDFREDHDYGFSRYYFPGKAHVDYWKDSQVFDNFIDGVVENSPAPESVPADRISAQLACYTLPYLAIAALLMAAVYFLYKPIYGSLHPDTNPAMGLLLGNVAGISSMLAGTAVMVRIPRMTHRPGWVVASAVVFAILATASSLLIGDAARRMIDDAFAGADYVVVAAVIALLAAVASYAYPSLRSRPLMLLGGLAVLWPAAHIALSSSPQHSAIWPILLGGAIFLYGWWLSILFFDLVFVWHWYIRNSKALERLRELREHA